MADDRNPTPSPHKRTWQSRAAGGSVLGGVNGRTPLRPSRRRTKAYIVLAVILALVGTLAAWLLFFGRFEPPHFVSLSVTEYRSPLYPANPWAEQDSQALAARFPHSNYAFSSQEAHRLIQELESLQERKDTAVVVHLCALAVRQGDEVYILPAHADPGKGDTWKGVPLSGVLDRAGKWPSKRKLLILDLMKPLANGRLGIPADDVGEAVEAMIRQRAESNTLNCLVLLACSKGQSSLTMDSANRSAFGYYLDEGLGGRADAYNADKQANGRVSVRELAAFVRERVERWSAETYHRRQMPVLIGEAADFDLTAVSDAPLPPATPTLPAYPTWLRDAWMQRDFWLADPILLNPIGTRFDEAPQAFARLEALLVRAERLWLAGRDVRLMEEEVRTALDAFREQTKPKPHASLSHSVFALAASQGIRVSSEQANELDIFLQLPADAPKEKRDMAEKQLLTKFPDALEGRVQRVLAVWESISKIAANELPAEWLKRFAARFAVLGLGNPELPFVEVALLRALAELTGPKAHGKVKAMQQAMKTAAALERFLTVDRRATALYQAELQEADRLRRDGLELLFQEITKEQADESARKLAQAETAISDLKIKAERLRDAYPMYARAMRLLPHYAAFLSQLADDDGFAGWLAAKQAAQQLGRKLFSDPAAPNAPHLDKGGMGGVSEPPLPPLAKGGNIRSENVDPLTNDLAKRLADLEARSRANLGQKSIQGVEETQALLATPLLRYDERQAIRERLLAFLREKHERVLEQDTAENEGQPRRAAVPDTRTASTAAQAARRAQFAVELLDLADEPDIDKLRQSLDDARNNSSPTAWQTLADRLRDRLGPNFIVRFAHHKSTADRHRWSCLLPPLDFIGDWQNRAEGNSTSQWRQQTDAFAYRWLADRFKGEAALYGDVKAKDWFNQWRTRYELAAGRVQ